jgi:hypothetical protein
MTQNKDKDSESKSGWGWGTYLIIVLWTWIGLTFIDSKVKRIDFINRINTELKKEINKNNQEVIPNNQYTKETIIPSDTPINVNLDEPIQNEVNYQTESNESYIEDNTVSSDYNSQTESNDNSSSNTYQESERQQQQPQRQQQPEKIKCNSCNGSGKCPKCGKSQQDGYYSGGRYIRINEIRMGMVICTHCHGYGIFMEETGSECGWCKGQGWEFCRVCNYYGRGNNIGQCQSCKGSGYRN